MKSASTSLYQFFTAGLFLLFTCSPTFAQNTEQDAALWQGIANGQYFAIMRHALAPGIGDPEEFDLSRCETQRNLSTEGRQQAERIGNRFRENGITSAEVYSSQWCRCRDTAEALGLGTRQDLPALNSFFRDFNLREPRTTELLQWLTNRTDQKPTVLVTHQVNISALLGVGTTSGEIVVFQLDADGNAVPLGSIVTP